ncbi:type I restriction-modification system subunit M [Pseudoalteromonas sp. Angola-20]|nr:MULTISPECIES: type I restriction-modification system subunit M [unclassified Pseudoalteromonas]MDC9520954.1 type I restriction-modification system subunit M [Pseudoalteromonas sp. Angola-31]MDC9497732.1 type I restriction-modification system subunit M [Pseudoalteromonas sp. Angola-20]MDC9517597.1 type I restriction-modification system subunit M [Pseudoalteromonas sp. Angola-22]MDC9533913.1 type I restriction-modification system subunit M [Pseudoalteromonas sp. Angola-9]TMP83281.1 type I res
MTSSQQRNELHRQIWAIANDVRGSVDGWDFKQYVLGTLFYRFISENFVNYITGGDESVNYAAMSDEDENIKLAKEDAIKTKGYFLYPSQLFSNVAANAHKNDNLNTDLAAIFANIENSANSYDSEQDIKGLFADFDTTSNRLGNTVEAKNKRLAAVLKGVAGLTLGNFEDNQIDLFGDAYEFLISNYAANAGKSGGEFFTPQHVSKLIAQLAMHGQTSVNKIYDPAAGSGSLLLQAKKHFDAHIIEDGFFGQELNHTTYNLARMNMFLHNINYDKFNIQLGDTLTEPHFLEEKNNKGFDAIVSNPPYSVKWVGSDDPTLINDDRFAPAGVLAPKSKADFAFVLHALSYLSSRGRAAIVCFPGIFYRGGAEQKIRKYLVDNNYVETVISLAPNLFFGTTIAVNILVLSKHKADTTTQFIDASGLFKKETNNNVLTDQHIEDIIKVFASKENVGHFAESVELDIISGNNYNLSVSSYVETKNNREDIDINELNNNLEGTVSKIEQLRKDINSIVKEIASTGQQKFMTEILSGAGFEYLELGTVAGYEQPTKYLVKTTNYSDTYSTPVLTAGKTFILGYTDETDGIYQASKSPVIIFDDFTTANKWVNFDFKAKSSAMKMITSKDGNKYSLKYIYFWLNTLPSDLVDGDHKRQWISNFSAKKIPIPCPENPEKSLSIQNRIVEILDKFTELNEELNEELNARSKQYKHYLLSIFDLAK